MRFLLKLFILILPIIAFAQEKPFIILDPGHGGKDEGAKIRHFQEKKMTLRTAYVTKRKLEALGYKVALTRARDIYLPLSTRVTLANKRPQALFISIHYNSSKSPSAKGLEIYYYGKGQTKRKAFSEMFATSLIDQLVLATGVKSRGIKQGNFQVLRETTMPAVLLELGFLTNQEERTLLATQGYLEKLGSGIAAGVDKYVKCRQKNVLGAN